jgi:putative sporulation protein YtaF
MALGGLVHDLVSPSSARGLGGALFVCLGLWQLWQGYHQYWQSANTPDEKNGVTLLARLHLRPLGIVIQILHEPVRADRDRSGSIEAGEAIALGVALGLDTLAAGFGASLAGFGTVVLLMVPLGLLALTWCGLLLGRACGKWLQKINSLALTGTLLILIGLLQMR